MATESQELCFWENLLMAKQECSPAEVVPVKTKMALVGWNDGLLEWPIVQSADTTYVYRVDDGWMLLNAVHGGTITINGQVHPNVVLLTDSGLFIRSYALQTNNTLYSGYWHVTPAGEIFAIEASSLTAVKFLADGQRDNSFNMPGEVSTGRVYRPHFVDAQDRLHVTYSTGDTIYIERRNPDGSMDASFQRPSVYSGSGSAYLRVINLIDDGTGMVLAYVNETSQTSLMLKRFSYSGVEQAIPNQILLRSRYGVASITLLDSGEFLATNVAYINSVDGYASALVASDLSNLVKGFVYGDPVVFKYDASKYWGWRSIYYPETSISLVSSVDLNQFDEVVINATMLYDSTNPDAISQWEIAGLTSQGILICYSYSDANSHPGYLPN